MENASDALKMGFAVLVLIAALSLAIYSFTRVRETSAAITNQKDIKEYYQTLSLEGTGVSSNVALSSRVVGVETVIPTLYRYYKENYTVLFYKGSGYNSDTGTFESIEPMIIYYTESNDSYLDNTTLITETSERGVYGFDIQDEQVRREPWSANQETSYNFIKSFVSGELSDKFYTSRTTSLSTHNEFKNDDDGLGYYYQIQFQFNGSTGNAGLIGNDYQFVERYGEYNYENVLNSSSEDEDNQTQQYNIISNITDSVDILENDEVVVNNKGTTKRVVQYILIN